MAIGFTILKARSFHVMGLQVDALGSNPNCNMLCLNNPVTSNFCSCTSSTPVCRIAVAPVTATQHWTYLKAFLRDCSELKRLIKDMWTCTNAVLYCKIGNAVVTKNLVSLWAVKIKFLKRQHVLHTGLVFLSKWYIWEVGNIFWFCFCVLTISYKLEGLAKDYAFISSVLRLHMCLCIQDISAKLVLIWSPPGYPTAAHPPLAIPQMGQQKHCPLIGVFTGI